MKFYQMPLFNVVLYFASAFFHTWIILDVAPDPMAWWMGPALLGSLYGTFQLIDNTTRWKANHPPKEAGILPYLLERYRLALEEHELQVMRTDIEEMRRAQKNGEVPQLRKHSSRVVTELEKALIAAGITHRLLEVTQQEAKAEAERKYDLFYGKA
jgi:hypothetical protein